jgi:hypothetical protein
VLYELTPPVPNYHNKKVRKNIFFGLISAGTLLAGGPAAAAPQPVSPRVVHVYVALCDNEHQGIVPVPAALGNGQEPAGNLYWGALYGVKTHFKRSRDWKRLESPASSSPSVLERCVFKNQDGNVYLIADAYRGADIKQAVQDFLRAAAGRSDETVSIPVAGSATIVLNCGGRSDLLAYLGHDGLMDFGLESYPEKNDSRARPVLVLACYSKTFFAAGLKKAGAHPLLWTTGLLAPEAYVLKAAVESWMDGDSDKAVAEAAAKAYHRYQKCGLKAAKKLLVTGW